MMNMWEGISDPIFNDIFFTPGLECDRHVTEKSRCFHSKEGSDIPAHVAIMNTGPDEILCQICVGSARWTTKLLLGPDSGVLPDQICAT